MFGKVIVFGLFEMIKKKMKSEDCVPGSGFVLQVGSGTTAQAITRYGTVTPLPELLTLVGPFRNIT